MKQKQKERFDWRAAFGVLLLPVFVYHALKKNLGVEEEKTEEDEDKLPRQKVMPRRSDTSRR